MFDTFFDTWSAMARPWSGAPAHRVSGSSFGHGLHEDGEHALHYRLFIPGGEHGPMPLVVMLHGCGQDATDFAAGTGMNALAEEHGCLVLYPEQSCGAHWNRCWNWYDRTHHRRGQGEPALIAGLTRRIMAEHAIDPARVVVAGLSAGGALAVTPGSRMAAQAMTPARCWRCVTAPVHRHRPRPASTAPCLSSSSMAMPMPRSTARMAAL